MIMEKLGASIFSKLTLILCLAVVAVVGSNKSNGDDFHLFYFVQQWLGSYCDQNGEKCCYPITGKPAADFTIYGLWPYYNDGSFPYNCGHDNFNEALIKPLQERLRKEWPSATCPDIGRKFWVHEWNKHGTCSMSVLDEIPYFQAALNLKYKVKLLEALESGGITPNDQMYSLQLIKQAIAKATGFNPWVDCNRNAQGTTQIWQVSMCVDRSGTQLQNCPFIPKGRGACEPNVKFPSFQVFLLNRDGVSSFLYVKFISYLSILSFPFSFPKILVPSF